MYLKGDSWAVQNRNWTLFNHLKGSEVFYIRKKQDLVKSSLEGAEEPAPVGWYMFCQGGEDAGAGRMSVKAFTTLLSASARTFLHNCC